MNEITIGDKTYISSKRAAEITGYAKDYVGQLCREGYVDAKMVGRSWYVFEPSIRAHRFGEDAVAEQPEDEAREVPVERPESPISAWEEPRYQAEEPIQIPSLDVPSPAPINRLEDPEYAPEAALTDMQRAWKEWFETRGQRSDEPEVIEEEEIEESSDDFEEGIPETDEQSVAVHRVYQPEEVNEQDEEEIEQVEEVRIERVYRSEASQIRPSPVVIAADSAPREARPSKKRHARSYAPVSALFIAVAIISSAIAAIGSGMATPYVTAAVGDNPVIEYIAGSRQINKQ